jgi:hypothetical protein
MSDYSICPRPREDQRAYRPCIACGLPILTAETIQGETLHLAPRQATYCVAWADRAPLLTACESRAYVVHTCPQQGTGTRRGRKQQRPPSRSSLGTRGETEFSPEVWRHMAERFCRMRQRHDR